MKVFLAALSNRPFLQVEKARYVLESFYYLQEWQKKYLDKWNKFFLDSGAFTFMSNSKKQVDWDEYVEKYASFINEHNIKYFFELDIDVLVGIEEVERIRKKLERLTGKKCIPVWHKSRGLEYWKKMCEEYEYVAIGGIVTKEIRPKEYKYLKILLNLAHKKGVKVHGLGFTSIRKLKEINFDSVDSTNWKSGGRFGQLHLYKDGGIKSTSFKNKRAKDCKKIDKFNFNEWVKFQDYADKNL